MECRKYINSFKTVCIYLSLSMFVFRDFNEAVKTPVKTFFGGGNFIPFFFFIKLLHTNSNVNGALGIQCKECLHVYAWLTSKQIIKPCQELRLTPKSVSSTHFVSSASQG